MFRRTVICILLASLFLAVGCSRLTTGNYDQLEVGMSKERVETILGEADECGGAIGIKNCKWGNEEKYIKVSFAGDKVVVFSGHGLQRG